MSGETEAVTFEQFAQVTAAMAEQLRKMAQHIVDNVMPALQRAFELTLPVAYKRYAIERLGLTEADVRSVDWRTGEIRTWNRRTFTVDRSSVEAWLEER